MAQKDYLKNLKILLLPILITPLITSCSSFPKPRQLEVQTVEVERKIPLQNRPRQLDMQDIKWYVVTEKNFEEFKKRFADENGELVGYVLSVRDYESLALNMADIKRYIEQQKEIIIYYEKAITPKER